MLAFDPGGTAEQPDLFVARAQMALSLAWHIVLACVGVGFPLLVLVAEWRWVRHGDDVARRLAHAWARALAVLFAVGAVSGTILSFELGMLWPGLMGTFGEVIGLPFTFEGIAFFIEAIFIGIWLYGWDRLSPWAHWWSAVPIVVSGAASACFVMTVNAWMNTPAGFTWDGQRVTDVDPWAAMFNPGAGIQALHMLLAAYMVAGFLIASVHAWFLARRPAEPAFHRLGLLVALSVACLASPLQMAVGHATAQFVAERQPAKFAAMEGHFETRRGAPLHIGGIPVDGEMRWSLEIPKGLSVLAFDDPDAEVVGLNDVPPDERPPVLLPHLAFQTMVGIGSGLFGLAGWLLVGWWRSRMRNPSKWFLRAALVAGPASVVAMEAGWIVTEVGRQPWIVQGEMKVADAVTAAPGLPWGYWGVVVVYTFLTAATLYVLIRLLRGDREETA